MKSKCSYQRVKVVAIVSALGIMVAAGLLTKLAIKYFEDSVVVSAQRMLLNIASAKAESIETVVSDIMAELSFMAENPTIVDAAASNQSFDDIMDAHGYSLVKAIYEHLENRIHGIYRLDARGIIQSRVPWDATRLGDDYSDKPGVATVIRTHEPHVSELFLSNSGTRCFSICHPIFKEDQLVGVVRAAVNLSTIQELVKQITVGKKGYIQVVDDDGWVLAHPMDEHVGEDLVATRREVFPEYDWSELEEVVKEMKSGKTGVGVYHSVWWHRQESDVTKKLTAFAPIRLGSELWSLGAVMGYDEAMASIKAQSRAIAAGSLLVALSLLAVGAWFFGSQRQMEKLATKAESVEALEQLNRQLHVEVTHRRKAENETRFERDKLTGILDSMEDGVCIINDQNDIEYANPALRRDLGSVEEQKCYTYFSEGLEQCPRCQKSEVLNGLTVRREWYCRLNKKTYDLIDTPITQPNGEISVLEILRDISKRKQTEDELTRYRGQLEKQVWIRTAELTESNIQLSEEILERKRLEIDILNIDERERRRIGQELHDSIGQHFTGISFMMDVLQRKLRSRTPELADSAAEITGLVSQAVIMVRGMARGLNPVDMDPRNLVSSVQRLVANVEELFGIHCTCKCDADVRIDDAVTAVNVYRILQESINNAIKHGMAKNIFVQIFVAGDSCVLNVENDGVDFCEANQDREGLGLQIMTQRVKLINGKLNIQKADKGGTIVTCTFPIKPMNINRT